MKETLTQRLRLAYLKWSARLKSLVKPASDPFIQSSFLSLKSLVATAHIQAGIVGHTGGRQPGVAVSPFIYRNY